ncbi:universal stress protein [Fibrella forsythiae]|uniref:Universal stress protein n=1 Tax=Fibrella forsythiae TaxID=2817061 RepID=A0ABS3JCJ2_9BACT|nr:universal stress protein [Fibrella forsythiae]MBO0947158.1 universal stress protein [Fibrella forsythiae]
MNTILVATDFSYGAHWATDYALALARHLHTRLVLIHAYDPLPNDAPAQEWLTSTAEAQHMRALHQLNHLREQMLQLTDGFIDISVVARPGSPSASVVEEAASQKADLLVMGVAGDEPKLARELGSLATDLIPRTHVPMLLVPPCALFQKPQHAVLAIDLSDSIDALAFDTVLRFATLLNVSLDVVCIEDDPTELDQNAAHKIRDLLRHQPHTFSFLPGYDLPLALETYFDQYKADLIMMLPKPHSRLRTYLLESVTQEVARLATIPVLAAF